MDTLVALGTGAAWLYSMSVNVWPQWFPMEARHLYYEASAMIIGLINLGHMLEARARQRSSKSAGKITRFNPADGPRGHGRRGKKRSALRGTAGNDAAPDHRRPRARRR